MFCPKCSKPSFKPFKGNELRCQHCQFTYFHNVAAAVALIIRFENKILLTRRAVEPAQGLLDLPGGFVDPSESLEQALNRELREELSINIDKPSYLFSFPNQYLYKDINYDTCDTFFEIKLDQLPKLHKEHSEISQICWIEIDELDMQKMAFDSARQALRRYIDSNR